MSPDENPSALLERAFHDDDAAAVRELFTRHPEFRARVNQPIAECFDSPPVTLVRSRAMLDVMLEAGADINAKSRWWAGGFALIHSAKPDLARYAIERGATVDIHGASRLGMLEHVRALVAKNPDSVRERGGDGQTPLHFASSIEVAAFLVDHGADINARDIDHESTPAQRMIAERSEIARYLVSRGCDTDIFMAAALGDVELVRKHLKAEPDSIRRRVSDEWFPMVGGKAGGTIYQWTLGWHVSPHEVAKKFGHDDVFALLMEQSPPEVQVINAARTGNESVVDGLLALHPAMEKSYTAAEQRQVAHAARNNELAAVRLLLKARLSVHSRGQHHATPLHWAAWHGNKEMVRLILEHSPDLEDADNEFKGTPMRWAIHGSENGWHRADGDYPGTVELLLQAGAKAPDETSGTAAVREVLEQRKASS